MLDADKRFLIITVNSYAPDYISTLTFGYAVIVLLMAMVLTPLCMPIVWIILYEQLGTIIAIVVSSVIRAVINKFEMTVIFDGIRIRVPWLFSIFELIQLYLNILAGIFSTIVRFIKAAAICFLMAIIPFNTVFCQWVVDLLKIDKMYAEYLAMIH
jgi:hypothetical protein